MLSSGNNINLAIGGDWRENPDATSVSTDMVYADYARVYQNIAKKNKYEKVN
jgi:hypothetical protein